ncbi:cyclic nucleotide-binding domain-containing protein [Kordiimonas lipolytica]|uniref:Cyclic nucleotide-binding domain-containing protein n=1 Tax=Kordiimonas lipolytica TaxID=1662421 RepID=A0ABV8UGE6_9PROT|nr:cyclic nucleotide-binding domain-containing protein [Kordiimonas lipolytica]
MTVQPSSMGEQVTFKKGDIIYAQDDDSTGVYMILDGQIDIWRFEGENSHHIAALGSGELLGEVSVIEKKKHSVTARASRDTIALFITAEAFRKSFSDPLVRHVVHTLANRLRSSYAIQSAIQEKTDQPAQYKSKHPIIEGESRLVADKLLTFTEVKEFPFTVGNISSKSDHAIVGAVTLKVPLNHTPELSDSHFEVIKRDGSIWIRDLGSQHGTMVNGQKLGKYTLNATAKLKTGWNHVSAGGPESPVKFLITVPPGAGDA